MTLRDSRLRSGTRTSGSSKNSDNDRLSRLRKQKRRQDRKLLSETLEQRQLLAGPDLVGIQPNEGSLLNDGTVLPVSPRELVFRFDDNSEIDPNTLSAIRISRAGEDGVFESATATSDLGTNGQVLVEFRASQSGSLGNGIQVQFTSESRTGSSLPIITVQDQTVTINVNSNPGQPTRVGDLVSAVANDAAASTLIEVVQVSGPSLGDIGTQVPDGLSLTLIGANSAEAVTDFGTNGAVRVRLVSQLPGVDGRGTSVQIERRNFGGQANPVIVVSDQTVRVQLNSATGFESTASDFINAINSNPDASALLVATLQEGNVNTAIGVTSLPDQSLTLSGVTDILVDPGFVGLGDSPREVVFRFAEPLPDDLYQIDIIGSGSGALRNVDGELFQDGTDLTRQFNINLGPKVVAVVPEPVRRNADGTLTPEIGTIEVHFNDDDLNVTQAQNPAFYQLIFTDDTVTNTDDLIVLPTSVVYNNITNIATLDFGRPLSRIPDPADPTQFIEGAARLRVGSSQGLTAPPTDVSLQLSTNNVNEPGDTFDTAFDLNSQWTIAAGATSSARLSSEIFNTDPFQLDLPGPDLPGTRTIRPDDPSRLNRTVPLDYVVNGADVVDGISVIQYNFANSWLGDDPNAPGINEDRTYFNIISEEQKERVREVIQLYSEYLGISFVEVEGEFTSDAFISIAVGDLYGSVELSDVDRDVTSGEGGLAVATRDRDGDGVFDLGIMDFQDFDESTDDQFGGEFFRGAMFVVGQLLGYGYADDLPQPVTQSTDFIFTPGTDNEPAFPAIADIVHGQYLYRPDSTDVDLYRFTLSSPGTISVETIAERLADPSLLDTSLKLYRLEGNGAFVEIAQNDDYFSNDSLLDVELDRAGTYVIGVSSRGNNDYDPNVEDSGFGGLTEGSYELVIDFTPSSTNAILDTTGVALDGDGDNRPGGVFDFWFVPSDSNNTLYVDKVAPAGVSPVGSVNNPFREIDQALAAAQPGDTIRILGNGGVDGLVETPGDNFAYQVGFASNGLPLADGSSIELPKGVRMVIDSGAILKLSGSRIGVGSVSPLIDVSDASLQILGTPSIVTSTGLPARDGTNTIIPGSVYFTSVNDTELGMGNAITTSAPAAPGDWGGIDFRGDLDAADESRRNRELEGVFLNHIQLADIRYGGGAVSIGGQQFVVSPIDLAVTRPTIINSRIRLSADAAIAATPDTFDETRFTDPFFQAAGIFTPDYDRVGPDISGNTIIDNSINGLFVRVVTRTGDVLETIDSSARFDDTDIPHILTENLVIEGTAGGPILQSSAPSSLLVRSAPAVGGSVPAGTYQYRLTNVSATGLESASSQATLPVTLNQTGSVTLSQLPTVASQTGFVSRRLYRAEVDPTTSLPGEFRLVAQLNASSTSFTDTAASGSTVLSTNDTVLRSRLDGRLSIDPGTVLKIDGARIEARFGAELIAEGLPSNPIVFTSLEDQRYGGSGSFDTNNRGDSGELTPGDWGGIYVGQAASASIDNAVIAGAGGATRVEGGFASFNALELHQANLRLTNTRFEDNADGRGNLFGDRVGRGDNATGTLFVRASAPVIANNTFIGGEGAAISVDVNSLSNQSFNDPGRSTACDPNEEACQFRLDVVGNYGPLIQGNVLSDNAINGMQVRGGQLATAGVWDDVDIVHVVTDSIEIPNQHIFGGLRLQSDARGSLVVKFQSDTGENAGIVVGGSLLTAATQLRDIPDRIGGSLQVVGHPDFPVVLTTLADDTAGAGFTLAGRPQVDTNNDGELDVELAEDGFVRLPTGPEVNRGTTIDNDVDINLPGYFEATLLAGNDIGISGVTVEDLTTGQVLVNQDYVFQFSTFVTTATGISSLDATTITQQPTLIADDVVESRGTFAGPGGTVNWVATSSFLDGVARLFTRLDLDGGATPLGDVGVFSYLDEDVVFVSDDILVTSGTPGAADFRAFTLDGPSRVGFSHGGYYIEDGNFLQNATYRGWAADQFNELQTAIIGGTQQFSIPGTIDLVDLPQTPDQDFGTRFGPNDVTTAFAWDTNPASTTATVTSFLELIAADPSVVPVNQQFEAGLWDGVVVREAASDRNVAAIAENEPVRSAIVETNAIPSQSQFLGEIAPELKAGDENRRLGFIVDGTIATRSDVDVYSFIAQSGTEVWLDIDRTSNQFDSVVELINANGDVVASSNDSLVAETNSNAIFSAAELNQDAAQPLSVVAERTQSQEITISESILDAISGDLTLGIPGQPTILVPVATFLEDPAGSISTALTNAYGTELGSITASLLRRAERRVDPDNPSIVTRFGDDFVVQLRFDADFFVGRSVPSISISPVGVVTPVGVTVSADVAEILLGSQLQDDYSSNPKDAGMRIRLPGESGTRNLYHVRVRSSNTRDPLDFTTLNDPIRVRDGLSQGSYQLQVRLTEADEHAGTQFNLGEVRYATTGLQIIGQPLHSPLFGEEYEIAGDDDDPTTNDPNDSLAEAQLLGPFSVGNDNVQSSGPLQSDLLAKSFAGTLSSTTDVDWYQFTVQYDNITRDSADLYLSTVFDLDYASGFARSDMALYVFDAQGQLVLVGGDSNIADDLPGLASSNNTDDLSRGSANSEDPYIGASELSEGTYFVAVSNQQQVPLPLDQFFNAQSSNPLLRLEPMDSVRRIAEDRIDSFGGGTATVPEIPLLFDDDSIIDYSFDDVLLYVNTDTELLLVNPFTGDRYGTVGTFSDEIEEIAFRNNGELFSYSGFDDRPRSDTNWFYYRIDTGDANLSAPLSAGAGVTTFTANITTMDNNGVITTTIAPVAADVGYDVEATTIAALGTQETGFFVANRPIDADAIAGGAQYNTNVLFGFIPETGVSNGAPITFQNALSGSASSPQEIGQIQTTPLNTINRQLGITAPLERNAQGQLVPSLVDGDNFVLNDGTRDIQFEIDSGLTLTANPNALILDGDRVQVDTTIFEFNTGERLSLTAGQPLGGLTEGTTVTVTGLNGATGTFEFVRAGAPADGNIGVSLVNQAGQPLLAAIVANSLATEINNLVPNVLADAVGDEVVFGGPVTPTLSIVGAGITIEGDNTVPTDAIGVNVAENADAATLVRRLADAISSVGISVVSAGTQLSLPNSQNVDLQTGAIAQTGEAGTAIGRPVLAFPGESSITIAQRISLAVEDAFGAGSTISVLPATAQGRSLTITGGSIVSVNSANGALTAGGIAQGGTITGVELVTEANGQQNLYAVDNNGGLYVVPSGFLRSSGSRQIGTPVATATDLIGLNFSALRSGPTSFDNGALRQTLFGITTNGDIYAFNTAGELVPAFAGGRSMISTGIFGARGLDFSTLGFNLFHTTNQRGTDAGHGIDPLFNGTRNGVQGGSSLAFTYEAGAFNNRYPTIGERPVIIDNNGNISNPRQDGTDVEDTFNLPGGAKGVVQSNPFSLEGFSASDEPVMYFNYFAETDGVDSITGDRDALRVYVVTSDGAQQLVASNNSARGLGLFDDEFDDPPAFGQYNDDVDADVQQLFDNTDSWRQARVPLGAFAGQTGLSLRIEFSTAGTTETFSSSIQTISGGDLLDGETFRINGQTFAIDLASSLTVPSGQQVADLYVDPGAAATVTVDGQEYLLDDGTRVATGNQVLISLTGGGADLGSLSASEIAVLVAEAIRITPPPNTVFAGLNFFEGQDVDPFSTGGRNDQTFEATPLPYSGGNVTLVGQGQLGNDSVQGNFDNSNLATINIDNPDDVDLFRVELEAGTTVDVSVLDAGSALVLGPVALRFFDAEGNELDPQTTVGNTRAFVAPQDGTYFLGVSGRPNENYDPQFDNNTASGAAGQYEVTFTINTALAVQVVGSTLELNGIEDLAAGPAGLFAVSGQADPLGIPIQLSRFMTASEVATEVQRVLADQFSDGIISTLPTNGNNIRIPGLRINDIGPFVDGSERYGDRFGTGALGGTIDNEFEGIYLDDFIIGFAERGEVATASNAVTTPFVTDLRPQFPVPADPTSDLNTGAYQVEIRGASEYVNSAADSQFRTFDTNDRLSQSQSITAFAANDIVDGASFELFDGRSTLRFEFDQTELGDGVTPGAVRVPYSLQVIEPGTELTDPTTGLVLPGTGVVRPQSAIEVAQNIVAAINRSDVRAVLDVSALAVTGTDDSTTAQINLFGDLVINNDGNGLADVTRNDLRGDDNRERDVQGIILVENSRFIFNQDFGIEIDHGLTANVAGLDTNSIVRYPRNLVELNTEALKPGVIIQSNVLAFNEAGGIQVTGIDPGLDETGLDPVPFDRIVNNTIVGGTITESRQSPAEIINGTLFAGGLNSFADAVVSFLPDAGGSPPAAQFQNSANALGAPDSTGRGPEPADGFSTVSLGLGGTITLQFVDNLLAGSGDSSPDLIVYETGAVESVSVEISRDGTFFESVGTVGGLVDRIDIDAFGFGAQERFGFVRLTDLRQGDATVATLGADIDAVGALTSVPVEDFTSSGTGVTLVGNASPVLLNNVIANSVLGIESDPASNDPILGGNTYYRNDQNLADGLNPGQFAQQVSDGEVLFVRPTDLVFAPSAGSSIIDSSIDSLQDRASLTTVKNPLGLPPSPILAPRLDVNGQLRVDDPNVETPGGLGERVFKDRGASDRGDLVGPRVVLLSPQAPNVGIQSGVVTIPDAPAFFEVQLLDGLAPADVIPGTGIDDQSISNDSVLLLQDNVALVEGVDYRFGYNPSTNVIRLTPIAGVWEPDSTYVIRMIDASDAIVRASDGDIYADGSVLNVVDLQGQTTRFEYETGISVSISAGTIAGGAADGIVVEVFDGVTAVTFELDDDGITDGINTSVPVPAAGNDSQIATALADAINASILNLSATANATTVQLTGTNPLSTASATPVLPVVGTIGTSVGFGIQIPADGAGVSEDLADGETFIIRRGANIEAIFELDNNGSVETIGATPVNFTEFSSLDDIAGELVRVIGGAGLGLSPVNAGFGRVVLGGDANYALDVSTTDLAQIGFPGQSATIPIAIGIDQTGIQIADTIAAAINGSGIAGVAATVADTRIFVEGTQGVSGVGAVNTVTIQDEVGNELQSNQSDGRTALTIFIGGGFDYGDAPGNYITSDAVGGPRHQVDERFSLGSLVTADSDAKLPNADDDDGVAIGNLNAGFSSSITVTIADSIGGDFYLDAWFDWDADGVFEDSEVQRFGSAGTGLAVLGIGANPILVNVPAGAAVGESYARFRLSRTPGLGSTGDASAGEVEDIRLLIGNNPFQNNAIDTVNVPAQDLTRDVNASGQVTPLDALQIINAISRNNGMSIQLDVLPLPVGLPVFPDVTGDGEVTSRDALNVINLLANLPNTVGGEGELIAAANSAGYLPIGDGVLASGATALSDRLTDQAVQAESAAITEPVAEKTSVFDSAASVQIDSIVDSIAEDTVAARESEEVTDVRDELFASL